MIDLIKELKRVMEERKISPEGASRYIGCAAKSIYRWLDDEATPNLVYQERIQQAIRKMKKLFPVDDRLRRGLDHLGALKTFLPPVLKIKDEKEAAIILADLPPDELQNIYVSGRDEETTVELLKKYAIETVRKNNK